MQASLIGLSGLLPALDVSRRSFLGTLVGGSTLALADLDWLLLGPDAAKPVVVQVHHKDAVTWDFKTGWYGDYVSQSTVDSMIDRSIQELTGLKDIAAAWRSLLPGYVKGRKIAIKVNFNCSSGCSDADNIIDAIAEPVNALVRGMEAAGVHAQDIWIYDAVRDVPARFHKKLRNNKVVTFARVASCGNLKAGFSGKAKNSVINFTKSGVPSRTITDVLTQAHYLINMPITKKHSAGMTLGYKNHFGSIDKPGQLHNWIYGWSSKYSASWNPLVEIMANPHIGGKTILTVADCLYGDKIRNYYAPKPWTTFGNKSPATLMLSTDPVAIDCVQRDVLFAESPGSSMSDDYLKLAAKAGQGVYEGKPGSKGYQLIDHRMLELQGVGAFQSYGTGKPGKGGQVPEWRFTGVPAPGSTVVVEVTKGLPGAMAMLAIGRKKATAATPFGTLQITPLQFVFSVNLDRSGEARIPLLLPSGASAVGSEYTLQAFVLDPAAAVGMSHTGGLHMRIGQKK